MKTSKWALFVTAAIILFGVLAAVPNVLTPEQQAKFGKVYPPANPVTLGLDLKGGSHLVLEVDAAALRKARMDVLLNDTRAILADRRRTRLGRPPERYDADGHAAGSGGLRQGSAGSAQARRADLDPRLRCRLIRYRRRDQRPCHQRHADGSRRQRAHVGRRRAEP